MKVLIDECAPKALKVALQPADSTARPSSSVLGMDKLLCPAYARHMPRRLR
jgi:hypothetical protein